MPYLVTKDFITKIGLDEKFTVVVPKMYATPCVFTRKDCRVPMPAVMYWDPVAWTLRKKQFENVADAEAFKESAWILDPNSLIKQVTAREVLANVKYYAKYFRIHQEAIEYEERDVPLDSRLLGIWLGDGDSNTCAVTTDDEEIVEYLAKMAELYDLKLVNDYRLHYKLTVGNKQATNTRAVERRVVDAALADVSRGVMYKQDICLKHGLSSTSLSKYESIAAGGALDTHFAVYRSNPITSALKGLGIFGFGMKRIPELYLENSRQIRLNVLGGLIDTDGYRDGGGYDMCFASKPLLDDIVLLARSLGFRCSNVTACIKVCTNATGGPKECQAYRARICGGDNLREIPLLLSRKHIIMSRAKRCHELHFKIQATP